MTRHFFGHKTAPPRLARGAVCKQPTTMSRNAHSTDLYVLWAAVVGLAGVTAYKFMRTSTKFAIYEARQEAFEQGVQAERSRRQEPPPFVSHHN